MHTIRGTFSKPSKMVLAMEWGSIPTRLARDMRGGIFNEPVRLDTTEPINRLIGQAITIIPETVEIIEALPRLRQMRPMPSLPFPLADAAQLHYCRSRPNLAPKQKQSGKRIRFEAQNHVGYGNMARLAIARASRIKPTAMPYTAFLFGPRRVANHELASVPRPQPKEARSRTPAGYPATCNRHVSRSVGSAPGGKRIENGTHILHADSKDGCRNETGDDSACTSKNHTHCSTSISRLPCHMCCRFRETGRGTVP